jgi:hypothetical protein
MVTLLDHPRKPLEECGLPTDGVTPSDIAERAQAVLSAADRYRLQAEAPVPDEHVSDEFQLTDAEAKMRTIAAEPYPNHVYPRSRVAQDTRRCGASTRPLHAQVVS